MKILTAFLLGFVFFYALKFVLDIITKPPKKYPCQDKSM